MNYITETITKVLPYAAKIAVAMMSYSFLDHEIGKLIEFEKSGVFSTTPGRVLVKEILKLPTF